LLLKPNNLNTKVSFFLLILSLLARVLGYFCGWVLRNVTEVSFQLSIQAAFCLLLSWLTIRAVLRLDGFDLYTFDRLQNYHRRVCIVVTAVVNIVLIVEIAFYYWFIWALSATFVVIVLGLYIWVYLSLRKLLNISTQRESTVSSIN
jgi:hypothetical protein